MLFHVITCYYSKLLNAITCYYSKLLHVITISHMLHVWYIYLHLGDFGRANLGRFAPGYYHYFGVNFPKFVVGVSSGLAGRVAFRRGPCVAWPCGKNVNQLDKSTISIRAMASIAV